MNKFCVLLDKVRSSTCFLSLFHSLPLKDIPQYSLLSCHHLFLPPKWIFPNGKQTYCFHSISKKSPSLDLTFFKLHATSLLFFAENPKKKCLYTWSPVPLVPFFAEFALNKLLVLPLHHNHTCQYHPWLQVFILTDSGAFDTAEYFDIWDTIYPFFSHLVVVFHSYFLIITFFFLAEFLGLGLCLLLFYLCSFP